MKEGKTLIESTRCSEWEWRGKLLRIDIKQRKFPKRGLHYTMAVGHGNSCVCSVVLVWMRLWNICLWNVKGIQMKEKCYLKSSESLSREINGMKCVMV